MYSNSSGQYRTTQLTLFVPLALAAARRAEQNREQRRCYEHLHFAWLPASPCNCGMVFAGRLSMERWDRNGVPSCYVARTGLQLTVQNILFSTCIG